MSFHGIERLKPDTGSLKRTPTKFDKLKVAIVSGDMEEFERLFDLLSNEDQEQWLNEN